MDLSEVVFHELVMLFKLGPILVLNVVSNDLEKIRILKNKGENRLTNQFDFELRLPI